MYRWLLLNRVEIFEYQRSVLHGKIGVADGEWTTVGSYNVNNLSAFASVELNLDVRQNKFAHHVETTLLKIIKEDCVPITVATYKRQTTWLRRVAQRGAYNLFRLILFIFTFYFKQRE